MDKTTVSVGDVCAEIRNYFVVTDGEHNGTHSVKNGTISLPFLADGQYFRIVGSVFNDGVYQYPAANLTDETFDGCVWAMAPTKEFLAAVDEINAYAQTDAAKATPYKSESMGGYSYTMRDGSDPASWQSVFRRRLNRWRKLP